MCRVLNGKMYSKQGGYVSCSADARGRPWNRLYDIYKIESYLFSLTVSGCVEKWLLGKSLYVHGELHARPP